MGDPVTITFECLDCGGTVLELPDNHTDESIAICKSCRRPFAPYGEIKAKALNATLADATARAKKSLTKTIRSLNRRR